MTATRLTQDNYAKGFLIDDECMGGVSEDPNFQGNFLAYVVLPATGESIGSESFRTLEAALARINSIPREWKFESASGCGGGESCSPGGCGGERCGPDRCKEEACPIYLPGPSKARDSVNTQSTG